jgi:hypothetical protein
LSKACAWSSPVPACEYLAGYYITVSNNVAK